MLRVVRVWAATATSAQIYVECDIQCDLLGDFTHIHLSTATAAKHQQIRFTWLYVPAISYPIYYSLETARSFSLSLSLWALIAGTMEHILRLTFSIMIPLVYCSIFVAEESTHTPFKCSFFHHSTYRCLFCVHWQYKRRWQQQRFRNAFRHRCMQNVRFVWLEIITLVYYLNARCGF